jgi:Protein of unknown function (DUF3800)
VHFAYLDEFGHIGPYVSRKHDRYNESPVFGLAGLILPATEVRDFSTWFYKRKCELLAFEINRSGKHPAEWEKKGAALFTTANIEKYPELRRFTARFLNRIERCGGKIIYVGLRKTSAPSTHQSQALYRAVLREAIKRLDQYCENDCEEESRVLIFMDGHQERDALLTEASRSMFSRDSPRRHLIEPPVQVESHRYQTIQAADWICGLIGRFGAYWEDKEAFPELSWTQDLFQQRLARIAIRSGIRSDKRHNLRVPDILAGEDI